MAADSKVRSKSSDDLCLNQKNRYEQKRERDVLRSSVQRLVYSTSMRFLRSVRTNTTFRSHQKRWVSGSALLAIHDAYQGDYGSLSCRDSSLMETILQDCPRHEGFLLEEVLLIEK